MRKLILKIFILFLPILPAATGMEVLLRRIPTDCTLKKEYLDAHSGDINTLILGSSHSLYGINPVFFSNNTFNASLVSQSLDYDYEILKKYEDRLGDLRTIILPISYQTLFGRLETSDESWRVKNYVIYYGIKASHSLRGFKEVSRGHAEILSLNIDVNLRRLYSYYINGKTETSCSSLGWHAGFSRDLWESGKSAALRHTAKNLRWLRANISTLESIIALCRKRNIQVLLITLPAFETYRQNLNEEQLRITAATASEMSRKYNMCRYVNLLDSPEFVVEDFSDADHLNERGAKKLSLLINDIIKP